MRYGREEVRSGGIGGREGGKGDDALGLGLCMCMCMRKGRGRGRVSAGCIRWMDGLIDGCLDGWLARIGVWNV